MIVYHLTPRINVSSITKFGLFVPLKKKGRIWFTTNKARLFSMATHICKHQGCSIRDMSVLILDVPGKELVKFGGQKIGIAVAYNDVPAERIVGILY